MNYSHAYSMFASITIGASLLLSGGRIAEFANANMYESAKKRNLVQAKKLDVNNDGLISLNELTRRQNQNYQKLGRKADGQDDEAEFNARLVVMFNRMDSNGDGMLDDAEISRLEHHHHGKGSNSKRLREERF